MTDGRSPGRLTLADGDTEAQMVGRAEAAADAQPCAAVRRGRTMGHLVIRLVIAVVVAGLISVTIQILVGRLVIPRPSFVATALTALAVFLVAGIVAVVVLYSPSRLTTVTGMVLPAAVSTVTQALMLAGSRFYLFGTGGDQAFRMQYMGRFAASAGLTDGNYADLPAFYPPAWFWLGGRLAALSGVPAWALYKPYSIATMAVAASVAFVLWSRVVRPSTALALSTATAVVGLVVGAYEPYGWLVAACVPPLSIAAVRLLVATVRNTPGVPKAGATILLGAFTGLAAVTYTLIFGFFVLVLGFAGLAAVTAGARPGDRDGPEIVPLLRRLRAASLRLALIMVLAGCVAGPVWLPYLLASLRLPSAGNGAARYLPEVGATFGAPMFEPSVLGLLSLLGLVWVVVRARHRESAAGLAVVVVACYVYYVLSVLALAAATTLLSFKMEFVLDLTLTCAGCLALADVVDHVRRRTSVRGRDLRIAVAVLAVLACVHLVQTPSDDIAPLVEPAFAAYDDQGRSAVDAGVPRDDQAGSWNAQLIAAVSESSGRRPQDVVMLTSYWPLLDFEPYRGFQTIKQEYANPLADFPRRRAEIESWARSQNAAGLLRGLDTSPFRPPNVFVLNRSDRGLLLTVSDNVFPLSEGTRSREVVFAPRLFDSPEFHRTDIGPYTVIARIPR